MRSDDGAGTLVGDLRAHCLTDFARDAARLRLIHAITRDVHATEAWQIGLPVLVGAARDGVVGAHDLHALSTDEVAAATGLARWHASREVDAAAQLCGPLVLTLAALEAGRIDGVRARVLAWETEGLPHDLARAVEAEVLDALPTVPLQGNGPVGPWDGPQPKTFTNRVRKAVARVRTDHDEQVRPRGPRTHRHLGRGRPRQPGDRDADRDRSDRAGRRHRRRGPGRRPCPEHGRAR